MTKLSREDMMEAISEGICRAFQEIDVAECLKEGVKAAVWRVATNATDMPCADFYDAIAKGMEKGIGMVDGEKFGG